MSVDHADSLRRTGLVATEAERVYRAALDDRAAAMRVAHADGWSLARIAEATGINRQRVHQIIKASR